MKLRDSLADNNAILLQAEANTAGSGKAGRRSAG